MQQKFLAAWEKNRQEAAKLGVGMRPVAPADALVQARRILSGHRPSDGFDRLAQLGRLDLSLEALGVCKAYTQLFDDEQANNALTRLLEAGYKFPKK